MELLAPAGGMESLRVAIMAGANAIYVGGTRFSARANAKNFTADELREAADLCHEHGVKLYAAVNTLVSNDELADVERELAFLKSAHVDAVIAQDLGVARLAVSMGVPLHASTQMTINNASGAAFARSVGASRVIAARECSLETLAAMSSVCEVEAFAHGALCVSVSGQCLFSSFIGCRSGNRGACAQACRLQYTYDGASGSLLSPRDQSQLKHLERLMKAGVCAAKIEGRQKRPSYVYFTVKAYRDALDELARTSPTTINESTSERTNECKSERESLLSRVFNRGAFTSAYIGGEEDASIINPDYAGNMGVAVGRVEKHGGTVYARYDVDVSQSDTLRIGDETYRQDANVGTRAALPYNMHSATHGCTIWRVIDAQLEGEAQRTTMPRIPVDMLFEAQAHDLARLTVTRDAPPVSVSITSNEPCEQSLRDPTTLIERQLLKTGGTSYDARSVTVNASNAHVPLSVINSMRRDALNRLRQAAIDANSPTYNEPTVYHPHKRTPQNESLNESLIVRSSELSAACIMLDNGADVFEWSPVDYRCKVLENEWEQYKKNAENINNYNENINNESNHCGNIHNENTNNEDSHCRNIHDENINNECIYNENIINDKYRCKKIHYENIHNNNHNEDMINNNKKNNNISNKIRFVLPEVLTDHELESIVGFVKQAGFTSVTVSNVGQIAAFEDSGVEIHTDSAIHAFNDMAADVLFERGAASVTLSPELTFEQIKHMRDGAFVINAYGKERLMLLSHCPKRTRLGLTRGRVHCELGGTNECAHGGRLTDRTGAAFPMWRVRTDSGCHVRLLNSVPTHLLKAKGFERVNASRRLCFYDESVDDAITLIRLYKHGVNDSPDRDIIEYTTAHAHRKV